MSVDGRYLFATFCDDIRYEQGNKHSLIGCYKEDLIISRLPATLPKLCVAVAVVTPIDRLFEKLILFAKLDDATFAELEIRDEQLQAVKSETLKESRADIKTVEVHCHLTFPLFNIAQPGAVRIEAETEDGVIKGTILKIRLKTQDEPVVT